MPHPGDKREERRYLLALMNSTIWRWPRETLSTVRILLPLANVVMCLLAARVYGAPSAVDFAREVQPILSDNCYHCHGPDEPARKAKLRLDTKEGAFRVRDGKAVIVPGKPESSDLVARIQSKDPDEVMPPPDSHRKLTPRQIEILTQWIQQGAVWGQHWAFVPPKAPPVPKPKAKAWARNEIDRFVLAKLEAHGLQPSPEAGRESLIRRLSLDLTGLPPTLAEVDAFLSDRSSKAHETLVDRLLASPAFGERMATDWLDTARYADTHGFQSDRYRPAWPYRDWVIQAYNANLPFDRFITWQLAGDLLPNPTREQRLATAFNRLHLQNEEGGIVEEEFRTASVLDRVTTMGTAFLALTLECSRCHDHKYDPISQKEFYQFFAFFNTIDEFGQTSYFTDSTPVPAMLLSDPTSEARLKDLHVRIRRMEQQRPRLREQAKPAFNAWLKSTALAATNPPAAVPGPSASFAFEEFKENKTPNGADSARPGEGRDDPKLVPGRTGLALLSSGDNGVAFKGVGIFSRHDPFSITLALQPAALAPRQVVLHRSQAANDAGSRGYEILLEEGHVAVGLHHMWPGNSIKVRSRFVVPTNAWTHLAVTYDGSSLASGVRLYVQGRPVEVDVVRDGLTRDITYERSDPDLQIGFRFRDNGFKGGKIDDLFIHSRALSAAEVLQSSGGSSLSATFASASHGDASALELALDFYVAAVYPPARNHDEALRQLRREEGKLVQSIPEMMVMEEMSAPRATRLLKRGAYDAPGEVVNPGTPAALAAFPATAPRNRLGLAQWLLSESQPLTSRVMVNRAWQLMFGRGLVETSDNFGTQGAQPTHPELLDWLAVEFRSHGWDWKALLKRIAMSATYRQSSIASAELRSKDPANVWLGRGPSQRLTAEMIRDQALAVSGLLVQRLGGPSVKPYQPTGLWEEKAFGAPRYDQGKGEDLHRRSLYTFWKRTVPHPAMIAFDAAERNTCIVRRQTTSTPLQALALLNDTQIVEASRLLGERAIKEGGSSSQERIRWLFRTVAARNPSAREIAVLERLLAEQRELFTADPGSAARWLAVGEAPNDAALDLADLAAHAILAKTLLNHDAAVMRR